jgi:hypothetical protein
MAMRQVTRPLGLVLAAVLAAATAGCDGGTGVRTTGAPSSDSAHPAHDANTTPTTTTSTDAPKPGSMDAPATTSGSLSMTSFPRPLDLGPGWSYSVDPGDVEEGYAGNGTPALARNPREVMQTAVPLGCDRTEPMPTPRHALEVDYSAPDGKVIALRTAFASRDAARQFYDARVANVRACLSRSGGPAIGPLVGRLERLDLNSAVSNRTPDSDPWTEIAVTRGRTVMLVALQGGHDISNERAHGLGQTFGG